MGSHVSLVPPDLTDVLAELHADVAARADVVTLGLMVEWVDEPAVEPMRASFDSAARYLGHRCSAFAPFFELHERQRTTQLDGWLRPPRMRGRTWSRVRSSHLRQSMQGP